MHYCWTKDVSEIFISEQTLGLDRGWQIIPSTGMRQKDSTAEQFQLVVQHSTAQQKEAAVEEWSGV